MSLCHDGKLMLLVCSYKTVSKQISISKRKANFLSNKVQQRCNHISCNSSSNSSDDKNNDNDDDDNN